MSPVQTWARADLRRRWRSVLALAVLAGLAGGVTVAAVAGARRTGTAYERYQAVTRASHAGVLNLGGADLDLSAVEQLPEVAEAAPFSNLQVYATKALGDEDLDFYAPLDERWRSVVDRPRVVSGRRPDPTRADEISVNRVAERRFGIEVGDRLDLVSFTPEQVEEFYQSADPGEPAGPSLSVTVVGIEDTVFDVTLAAGSPGAALTPAFTRANEGRVGDIGTLVFYRLRRGAADYPAFLAGVQRLLGADVEVVDLSAEAQRVHHVTDVERGALAAFALVTGVAGVVLVGQALLRLVGAGFPYLAALRALGFTRTQAAAALGAPGVVVGLVGGAVAVGVAVAASPRFPIGLARQLEPAPGVRLDWPVLVAGAVVLCALVALGAGAWAWRGGRAGGRDLGRRSRVVRVATASRLPPPAVVGVQAALETARGPGAVPGRPALVAAVVGVLGVIGALTFRAGLDHLLSSPELFGSGYDVELEVPLDGEAVEQLVAALDADPDVAQVSALLEGSVVIDGQVVPALGIESYRGDAPLTVLDGNVPDGPDEVLFGAATLDQLGHRVGDVVQAGDGGARLRIVGRGLLPDSSSGNFDTGAALTTAGLERASPGTGFFGRLAVGWRDGADVDAAEGRLASLVGNSVELPTPKPDVENLRTVRGLPLALAAFFAIVALGGVNHALVTGVRRRRHELAVLRALGLTRRDTRRCVRWQATTMLLVGLVLGVPLGIAVGRVVWRVVADATPVLYVAPLALAAVVLIVPLAFVAAVALAAVPGRMASRLTVAEVLRSE